MKKKEIIEAIIAAITQDKVLNDKVFGEVAVGDDIEKVILSLSSIDFVDLLINVETILGFEFAETCSVIDKITIGDLAERIEEIV